MANFEKSFEKTMIHEGGYSFDPDDAGGETYKGVSRRFHPSWYGWILIDGVKKSRGNLKTDLDKNEKLQNAVKSFYKQMFWDRLQGDSVSNQEIAEELYDTAVNLGIHRAVIFLQSGLNLLNRDQKNYPDILEDGDLGPKTLKILNTYLKLEKSNPKYLLKIMNTLQGMHYINYMKEHSKQEKYARGWLNRI